MQELGDSLKIEMKKKPKRSDQVKSKKSFGIGLILAVLVFSIVPSLQVAHANKIVAGGVCKKAGKQEVYKSKIFTCIKLGKKLYWNNGVKFRILPTASSQPTPSNAPSINPTAIPTPSLSSSPQPTVSPTITNVSIERVTDLKVIDLGSTIELTLTSPKVTTSNSLTTQNVDTYDVAVIFRDPWVAAFGGRSTRSQEWNPKAVTYANVYANVPMGETVKIQNFASNEFEKWLRDAGYFDSDSRSVVGFIVRPRLGDTVASWSNIGCYKKFSTFEPSLMCSDYWSKTPPLR